MAKQEHVAMFSAARGTFTNIYDNCRPAPPPAMKDILAQFLGLPQHQPHLVVDVGCGTGLSTRYWYGHCGTVVGIEPGKDMRQQAESQIKLLGLDTNKIQILEGHSGKIDLPSDSADIMTYAQALHWMEPTVTFAEAGRVLREGGLFVCVDYDFRPTINGKAEMIYKEFSDRMSREGKERNLMEGIKNWEKHEHHQRMKDCKVFRYTHELYVHSVEEGDADRLIGFAFSNGHVERVLGSGIPEEELGVPEFKAKVKESMGNAVYKWFWTFKILIGVK